MTIICPDCSTPFRLHPGDDGGVCCLSYMHADGRIRLATTPAESIAHVRAVCAESYALVVASPAYQQATTVGNYQISKTTEGYTLATMTGEIVGVFPTARAANTEGVALTAKAYKARVRA